MTGEKVTYKDSGVDIKAGEDMVESIKEVVRQTHSGAVLSDIGGFGGFFRPDVTSYKDPVLVSSVDGVGTKLMVAFKAQKFDTIGQDLVNHCVNDIAVCGADPLFFLDYFSTGKLDNNIAVDVIKGFATACKENGVALIGGETAEMPDMYQAGEFDLAGTIVGMVERNQIIDGKKIKKGDVLLGFKSNGLHTNGYSLARKVLFSKFRVNDTIKELDATLGETLLQVHKSYLPIIRNIRNHTGVHGFSHITGGGIIGNTKRILPQGRSLQIEWNAWKRPPIFELIKKFGNVPEEDMWAAFNLGIGLIAVVDTDKEKEITEITAQTGEPPVRIGKIK